MPTELHCYEYVSRPFSEVRDALIIDAVGIFSRATTTASERAQALVSKLKFEVAGFDVGRNIVVRVTKVHKEAAPGADRSDAIRLELEWSAESARSLFPSMHASLLAYPFSPTETQLDLLGRYEPPAGILGSAADRLLGHRIAAASVHRFLEEVARRLNLELQ